MCLSLCASDDAPDSGSRRVRTTFGSALAAECTPHAAALGQQDVYIHVCAGEIVKEIKHAAGWALVKTHRWQFRAWAPSAYLVEGPQ